MTGRRGARAGGDVVAAWRIWAGILVPPLAWALQFNAAYFLVARECQAGVVGFNAWLFAVSIVGLVVAVASGLMSFSAWRSHASGGAALGDAMDRTGALSLLGVALSAVFSFAIVLTGLTQVVVPSC